MAGKSSQQVKTTIIQGILGGVHPPGSQLPGERELAARLGVGRATLREALQGLERDGWVSISHGRTTVVNDFFTQGNLNVLTLLADQAAKLPDLIIHLLEVRKVLAPEYAREAVRYEPARVVAYLAEADRLDEGADRFAGYDWGLHRTLAILSRNPIYPLILNGFSRLYLQMAPRYFQLGEGRDASRSFYQRLLQAAMDRDPQHAENITREVMQQAGEIWNRVTSGGLAAAQRLGG